jgi:hypothetical protein
MLVLDVTAIDIASGNETYQLDLMVSNDPNFAAAPPSVLPGIQLGKGASLRGAVAQKDSVTGRSNSVHQQVAGNIYQFMRRSFSPLGGTTPSINISPSSRSCRSHRPWPT